MLTLTPKGLFCEAGDFYIDPSRGVDHAVITHAHSDHARRGSRQYYTALSGVDLLRARVGKNISVEGWRFGEKKKLGAVYVSLHPAGHILGSAQVRIERGDEVWVASGDYKREPDPTCEPFESVPCQVFVTEATFGTPFYAWTHESRDVGAEIFDWWQENSKRNVNSILFAYSLGKAQRILGLLHGRTEKPIYVHWAVTPLNECYRAQGINLASTICLSSLPDDAELRGELILAPPGFFKSERGERMVGTEYETAFASGWVVRDRSNPNKEDRGFILSDHADWHDLVRTVRETGARRVYVQHRGHGALVRHLQSLGLQAYPDSDLVREIPNQMELF